MVAVVARQRKLSSRQRAPHALTELTQDWGPSQEKNGNTLGYPLTILTEMSCIAHKEHFLGSHIVGGSAK